MSSEDKPAVSARESSVSARESSVSAREYMLIGGRRNGERRRLMQDRTQWTDLLDGVTYYKRALPVIETNSLTGERRGFYHWVFAHEQITDPATLQNTAMLAMFLEWMRKGHTFNLTVGPPADELATGSDSLATAPLGERLKSGLIVPGGKD